MSERRKTLESQGAAKAFGDLIDAAAKTAAAERQLREDYLRLENDVDEAVADQATAERALAETREALAVTRTESTAAAKAHASAITLAEKTNEKLVATIRSREDKLEALARSAAEASADWKREGDGLRTALVVAQTKISGLEEKLRKVQMELA